jgi:hypothetical protein
MLGVNFTGTAQGGGTPSTYDLRHGQRTTDRHDRYGYATALRRAAATDASGN